MTSSVEIPILRATSENDDVIDDPSEDALFMMLEDIERGDGTFLIVESPVDSTGGVDVSG